MECSFGITGKGYTIVASDCNAARSIVKMKGDEDKMRVLSKHLVMAYSGEAGDTLQFSEYVERNLRLYEIRYVLHKYEQIGENEADAISLAHSNHVELRPRAAGSWIRVQLAESLRSRKPYQVNAILGGFDVPTSSPALFWLDYLGTLVEVPYAVHGYAAHFTMGTLDRYHRPDMDLDEGLQLLRRCIDELKKRFIVDLGTWKVRVIDRQGVREVEL